MRSSRRPILAIMAFYIMVAGAFFTAIVTDISGSFILGIFCGGLAGIPGSFVFQHILERG